MSTLYKLTHEIHLFLTVISGQKINFFENLALSVTQKASFLTSNLNRFHRLLIGFCPIFLLFRKEMVINYVDVIV